ncbi:MAG: MarR family transcriptional regulator [Lachnospiraceae bacterium]|nr:MarR family transcriptional regulator [Lachnospiraceae bacterium]
MDDLISLITASEMISIPELCEKLHMSKDMVLARLERCEQLGYIKRVVEKGTSNGCTCNCSTCKGCHTSTGSIKPMVYWTRAK